MIFQQELIESLQRNADRTAIDSGARSISYAAVLQHADRITRALLKKGLENETIGILVEDRVDLVSAMIGAVNARTVFVPLDGSLPDHRLQTLIGDLDLGYLIASGSMLKKAAVAGARAILHLEELLQSPAEGKEEPILYPQYRENDSLYVYFTSGSTGTPKGIVGKNDSLLQFLQWEISTFEMDGNSRVSQFISPFFDAFLRDIFAPLLSGGTICIPPEEEDFFTPEKIISWIDSARITLIHCVPSIFRVFNGDWLTPGNFQHLTHVLLSGEKVIPGELLNWYRIFGSRIQLVNLYGPTETTMIRSCYKIKEEDAGQAKIPIGSPIAGTSFLIAKEDLRPCEDLVPGELYIISDYMTKGYLNAPELTNHKFIKLYPGTPDEKIAFRTGDSARRLINGEIDLLGREDRQVKLRGIRIELDEIEQVLIRSGLVKTTVVMIHAGDNGKEFLLAFLTRKGDRNEHPDLPIALQQYLADRLPAAMIPSAIIEIDAFPLLSNGKIDIRQLPAFLTARTITEPVNEMEHRILSIWKEILGDAPVSTDESFIRAGGNSLSTMRLVGRIYKEFNVRISLGELFNNLTIQTQAAWVESSRKDTVMLIPVAEAKSDYPLSLAQERIYYQSLLTGTGTAFNLPMVWKINGRPDSARIENVIRSLIARHECLRTVFSMKEGKMVQVIKERVDFKLEKIDCGNRDIKSIVQGFMRPFDLASPPLIRCGLVTGREDMEMLVVDIHHIVCDGMSEAILSSDFLKLYNGQELQPLRIQYKDYAEWEKKFTTSGEYHSYREFWLQCFDGEIPKIALPSINSDRTGLSSAGGAVIFYMDAGSLRPLMQWLKKEEITLFSGLFSIYFLFLSQLTGQEDIVIGATNAGRLQTELEDIVGMFVKILPIRYQLDPDMTFDRFLDDLHRHLIRANSRQVYDLTSIISDLNSDRASAIHDLFEVAFSFLNFETRKYQSGNGAFSIMDPGSSNSKYPITMIVWEEEAGTLGFRIEYRDDFFTRADIEILADQFRTLTRKICENPRARIIEIIGNSVSVTQYEEDDISFTFDSGSQHAGH